MHEDKENGPGPSKITFSDGDGLVKNLRAAAGVSQAVAADSVGIGLRTWKYFESGSQAMPPTILELFGLLWDIRVSDFTNFSPYQITTVPDQMDRPRFKRDIDTFCRRIDSAIDELGLKRLPVSSLENSKPLAAKLREATRLEQNEAAKLVNVQPETWSVWEYPPEHGGKPMPKGAAMLFCIKTGLDLYEVIDALPQLILSQPYQINRRHIMAYKLGQVRSLLTEISTTIASSNNQA